MPVILVLSAIVNIVIDQHGGLPPALCQWAVAELAEIWRDAGVEVVSRPIGGLSAAGEASVSLRIVTFSTPRKARGEPVLAWVAVEPGGRLMPVVLVSLPTLRLILQQAELGGIPFKRLTSDLSGQLTARAIGRIAAHELGHYLLQRAGHRRSGLMRPSYAARDLTGPWLGPFRLRDDERFAAVAEIMALARLQHARSGRTSPDTLRNPSLHLR